MYKKKLLELGIPADIRGFEYLNYALEKFKPPQRIMPLYENVAQQFQTTPARIERAMRHAIGKTNEELSNGRFIAKYKILWEKDVKQ